MTDHGTGEKTYGARTRAENKDGKTPSDLAKEFGCDCIESVINDTVCRSVVKVDKLSLQSVYPSVLSGKMPLTEELVKEMLVPEKLHGMRDLWMGHNLLLLARGPEFQLYPMYDTNGAFGKKHYFFRHFYKHIVDKDAHRGGNGRARFNTGLGTQSWNLGIWRKS